MCPSLTASAPPCETPPTSLLAPTHCTHLPLPSPTPSQNHEQLKGRSWVLEADMRSGTAVRLDKTGKTLLTLLRHLGRLAEVRVPADGATHLVYVMLPGAATAE